MNQKIALVSGATKGIGLGIAKQLIEDGFFVIGTYVSQYDENKIKALENENFILRRVDATSLNAIEQFADEVKNNYGHINVLVNNAGIVKDNLVLRMDEQEFKDVIDVNLIGSFNMVKAFSRHLLRSKEAAIVNISSVIGLVGNVGQSNYAASKAGLIGLSKSLAKEFASRNVRVNVVAPGFIQTDMTDKLSDKITEDILDKIALKRLGDVEDVAHAVSFLTSDKAKYITGQTLNVCGGMVI
ncbi:MAG TPA: 3-oxoacyl-ACP reductase FabG [Erysipelothrix sp.]|nr:3-oxoacyl-ACP reductase FabG [Erysipelothrix sp.]